MSLIVIRVLYAANNALPLLPSPLLLPPLRPPGCAWPHSGDDDASYDALWHDHDSGPSDAWADGPDALCRHGLGFRRQRDVSDIACSTAKQHGTSQHQADCLHAYPSGGFHFHDTNKGPNTEIACPGFVHLPPLSIFSPALQCSS